MLRKFISLLILGYAFAFALAAMAVMRWPTIMMALGWATEGTLNENLQTIDWREFGVMHGGPYAAAALCFYCSAAMVSARRRGGILWYIFGLIFSTPVVFLVSFEPGWWQDPSETEGMIAGAMAAAFLLLIAVMELRYQKRKPVRQPVHPLHALMAAYGYPAPHTQQPQPADNSAVAEAAPVEQSSPKPVVKSKHPVRVSAAVARQRESFAYHGRKMQTRREMARQRNI